MLALRSPKGLSGSARKWPASPHTHRGLGGQHGGPGQTPSCQLSCGRSHRATPRSAFCLKP